MKRTSLTLIAASLLGTTGVAAQTPPVMTAQERAQQTLPEDVFQNLRSLADELAASGIPETPLYNKALEGLAKGIRPEQVLPAVRSYGNRLTQARAALGPAAEAALLVAGADAIQGGVPVDVLRSMPRDRPRSPIAVLVLKELMESGVPADRAMAILRQAMQQRTQDAQMLNISDRVRRLIREGVPPQEAIDRVRRALQRDRGGLGLPVPTGSQPTDRIRRRISGVDGLRG